MFWLKYGFWNVATEEGEVATLPLPFSLKPYTWGLLSGYGGMVLRIMVFENECLDMPLEVEQQSTLERIT